ncbi:LPS export ABC transporter periplasmic protein LptC [Phenylobacterium sp.]|uniref:LPS export ABC transporter periplasmic protein LptC n=1 Tax=Phenylobacterium sp. TaxID=1871053 RepID=UPI003982DF95
MSTDLTFNAAREGRRKRLVWVRVLRLGLPLAAATVVAGVAGQIAWRSLAVLRAPPPVAAETAVRMINPSFRGQGRDGSRYVVTARSGVRDAGDAARILLDSPTVFIGRAGEPDGARSVAQRGVFREDDLTLRLEGDVRLERGGSRFVAKVATINTATGQISGEGLKGAGDTGAVQADSYAIDGAGDRMVLKGGVRARISGR